ncbi:MAG TPA: serine/threonine-protein kinase PknK [Rhodopirellula baltica]|uniref:Probable serine/threonine protein kinase PpkA n=1 Tax=Rhodopirellula baltica (strain DSM 10527 / NCIMB 13988 / SH1) TaxID=243090 RepID=Q7UT11_RHOBA|nr:serine/threonine-protein kinase [Rhodopirellula baltica]CAD73631.1 probable serine/threonine protein kinase PpkA [Rhodopirellula baltica SH 1]HBE62084.1 serine/threonine-protein kinase PknK [Rhodopirellula baltica]
MSQWEDYTGDEWMRPLASQDTRTKHILDRETQGIKPRPRLQAPPFKAGDTWGEFTLDEWLGSGTHGWVFAARENATEKPVALKILAVEDDPGTTLAKTGFRRMAKLNHRNLMRLHGIHEHDKTVAFSMERIDGVNLTTAIRRWRNEPLDVACEHITEMVRQIGSAIGWMHARELVHRDLKPSNIMVTDDYKRFVVIDYDSAGMFQEHDAESMRAYLIWTPMYVAPEVLVRQRHTPSSDVFSLGMVVLEALRVFSAAQYRREGSLKVESRPTDGSDESLGIRRDKSNEKQDRMLITNAVRGLHPSIPADLLETLDEMLAPDEADRPMAMTLSRLGRPLETMQMTRITDVDSSRVREATQQIRHDELARIHRWSHLVLGGQVQRLHLSGDSGIGKSTLLDVALSQLRSLSWAQVFVARCQQRDQKPLQAFSQISDEITMRFRGMDREPLQVDSVTVSVLTSILPGLAEVLEVDRSQPLLQTSPTRPGGLEAALKVCERLREYGPVFFVIDDVQWADRDTISVLDYLQSGSMNRPKAPELQGLGLITVSRTDGDRQITLPDETINLGPLPDETAIEMLMREASKYELEIPEAHLKDLASQIDGLPYRLDACLEELRPGGWLSDAIQKNGEESDSMTVPSMETLWQSRCEQLPPGALQLLRRIAAAGRQLPVEELRVWDEDASSLEDHLDELQRRRLIVRGESSGPTVQIWHSRLGERILDQMSEPDIRQLHLDWAETLSHVRPDVANVIASHYQRAEAHEPLAEWAKLAAEQAQQMFAHREVASWLQVAADHSDGEQRIAYLKEASFAWHRSGLLSNAAMTHEALAKLLDGHASVEQELHRVECLIRSGEFSDASRLVEPLIDQLGLPRLKSKWAFKLSVIWRIIRLLPMQRDLTGLLDQPSPLRTWQEGSQIEACNRLIRPLSIINNNIAVEWSLFAARQVRLLGTAGERLQLGVGEAVFNCYSPGKSRQRAGQILERMSGALKPEDDPSWHADVNSGLAWHAAMDGRYADALAPCARSKKFYALSEHAKNFEIAHTSYVELASFFQCGMISEIRKSVAEMQAEGRTTNDQFVTIMGTLGYASVAFFSDNDLARMDLASDRVRECMKQVGATSFLFVQQFKDVLHDLYAADVTNGASKLDLLPRQMQLTDLNRVQMIRINFLEFVCLLALQALSCKTKTAETVLQRSLRKLRRERSEFAKMKADFYEGIQMARSPVAGMDVHARERLVAAHAKAEELRLTPFVLAASDELKWLEDISQPSDLEAYLADEGVVAPSRFARLYRGVERPEG